MGRFEEGCKVVSNSEYVFPKHGIGGWFVLYKEIMKELDKQKIPLGEVVKIVWEEGTVHVFRLGIYTKQDGKIVDLVKEGD